MKVVVCFKTVYHKYLMLCEHRFTYCNVTQHSKLSLSVLCYYYNTVTTDSSNNNNNDDDDNINILESYAQFLSLKLY
jgi:hypothetical protein